MINLTNIDAVEVVNRINSNQVSTGTSIEKISKPSSFVGKNQDLGANTMLNRLQSSLKRVSRIQQNLQNSLSFAQAQSGALDVAGKILNKMSVLRVRASDPTKTDKEIEQYNYEFKELQRQLCEMKKSKFNKVSLFKSVDSNSFAGVGIESTELYTKSSLDLESTIKHTRAGLFDGMIPLSSGKRIYQVQSGGYEEDRLNIEDAHYEGNLTLEFDAKTLKDNVKLYHEGNLIFNSGEITGSHIFDIPYAGKDNSFEVVVNEGDSGEIAAAEGAKLEGSSWFLTKPAFASDGTIYAGSFDQNLYAYSPEGSVKWTFAAEGSIVSSPKIGPDGTIYFGSGVTDSAPVAMGFPAPVTSNTFYALNPNGTEKWQFKTLDGNANSKIYSTPALAKDGTIYFGSRASDSRIYALDEFGNVKWAVQKPGQEIYSSPALSPDESTVYVGVGSELIAFDTNTGAERWTLNTGNFIGSSPAVTSDGNIYFGSNDGSVYGVDPDGNQIWSKALGVNIYATPAFSNDETMLYVGEYNGRYAGVPGHTPAASKPAKFYAIDRQTGDISWDFQTQGGVVSTAEIDERGNIFVGSADTNLYSISPEGEERWKFSTGGKVIGSPSVDDQGRVFVGSRSAALFMVEEEPTEWNYELNYKLDEETPLCDDRFHLMDFEITDFVSFIEGWSDFVAANGSEIARLKSELGNIENSFVNLEHGIAKIDDFDLAEEMAKMNKKGVLQQAAIKGLLTIRSMPEEIMRILHVI